MNYLVQFLSVLNDEELKKIKNFDIKGKEKKLLDILIEFKNKDLPKDTILEKLQFSETHFYKICSVLLDKCYEFLFDGDIFQTLKFLSKRDLYQNLKHEIFQQEKKYYYNFKFNLLAFELLQRGSYKNHQEEIIHYFSQKLLDLIPNIPNPITKKDLPFFLEIRRIRSKIFELAALQKTEEAKSLKKRLLDLEQQLDFNQNAWSKFHLYHALYNYYNFFESYENNIHYLDTAFYLVNFDSSNQIEKEDIVLTQLKIAENSYYLSEFLLAYEKYQIIQKDYPHIFYEDYYHLTKFIQIGLIIGDYKNAEQILDKCFLNYLKILHPTRGTMAAISYTKLFLLKKDFKEANIALQKAIFLNDKNFYLPYEFEIRLLESTLVFLTEDFDYFEANLKKQYKYFRNKGLKSKESNYVNYLRFLEKIAKSKGKNKKFNPNKEFQTIYEIFHRGSYAVYGKLLDLCLQN